MDLPENSARVRLTTSGAGDEPAPQLLVDDEPVRFGQFADGVYFVYENAYVWSEDLRELGHRLVDDRIHGRVPTSGEPSEDGE
jgi:hypothetical protein